MLMLILMLKSLTKMLILNDESKDDAELYLMLILKTVMNLKMMLKLKLMLILKLMLKLRMMLKLKLTLI